jgi:type II secretory pathway component PulK
VTFCEMSRLDAGQIERLKQELMEIMTFQLFKMDFKPITKTVKSTVNTRISNRSRTSRPVVKRKVISAAEQVSTQTEHFARLFHSSLLDIEALAVPTIVAEDRQESALKYMSLWGTRVVNINTAPRHVLEAAFIFGGNEVAIAEDIIQLRREKPFTNVEEFKTALPRYSDSVAKCAKYITTESRIFTIRITATSGAAKASTLIAVTKEGKKIKRIAAING